MTPRSLIISCEHAVNKIPPNYQHLFDDPSLLNTHQAYDRGALEIASQFSQIFHCPLMQGTASRLLIDCNRSLTNPSCFSSFTRPLATNEKQAIIDQYYTPFRQAVQTFIADAIQKGHPVLHLSIHSFTPIMNNIPRNADIGLLYDPRRCREKQFAKHWRDQLLKTSAAYHIRMNYPYRGIGDGFVTALRKQYPEQRYLGIEVESNQRLMTSPQTLHDLAQSLCASFEYIYQQS